MVATSRMPSKGVVETFARTSGAAREKVRFHDQIQRFALSLQAQSHGGLQL